MPRKTGSSKEPTNRLGRIAAAMLQAREDHPEYREEDKAVIMLNSDKDGMTAHGGYGDNFADLIVNAMGHVEILAETAGLDLTFVPVERNEG